VEKPVKTAKITVPFGNCNHDAQKILNKGYSNAFSHKKMWFNKALQMPGLNPSRGFIHGSSPT